MGGDKVGAKADPAAIAAKYQGKAALLVRHFNAKYKSAPKVERIKYRPRTKEDDKKPEKAPQEQKCQSIDVEEVVNGAPSETLEAELEKRRSVEAMSGDVFDKTGESMGGEEKVVVVGGGPAGLAAAIYAARAGLKPVVVAPPFGGQLMGKGVDVENYPGLMDQTGPSVVQLMQTQAISFGTVFLEDLAAAVDTTSRPFIINTPQGDIKTHSIIIATGADSRWLGAEGGH